MVDLLACLELEPDGPSDGSVVWMHGLGADGHDFEPIVPMLRQGSVATVRFVFPHAPSMPVTINGGFVMPAWYDIVSLEHTENRENESHIVESAQRIVALVDRERERGIPAERIVIAGFSQGAAMALHVGLQYPAALAGIMALSGYFVLPSKLEAQRHDANRGTPMLFCHGTQDPLVPVGLGRAAYETAKATSTSGDVQWHDFPIGHEVSLDEIVIVAAWLRDRFATQTQS
jgi:phospholipase/carboxylesterase